MIAADASVADPKTLSELQRVRRMRLEAAEAQLKASQQALRREEDALELARKALRMAEQELIDFRHYMVNEGATQVAALSTTFGHYRASLDQSVVGCTGAVERGVNVVRNAKAKVDESILAWRRAAARCDALDEVSKRSRAWVERNEQNQADEELGDRVVKRPDHALGRVGR